MSYIIFRQIKWIIDNDLQEHLALNNSLRTLCLEQYGSISEFSYSSIVKLTSIFTKSSSNGFNGITITRAVIITITLTESLWSHPSLHRAALETILSFLTLRRPSWLFWNVLKSCWPTAYLRNESPRVSRDSKWNSSWHFFVVIASKTYTTVA